MVENFIAQFGATPDPQVNRAWYRASIKDEPNVRSNEKGTLAFAKSNQLNSRTTQIFINLVDNKALDTDGFAPFGIITAGMDTATRIYSGYGQKPDQNRLFIKGEEYLEQFPKLDRINRARILK